MSSSEDLKVIAEALKFFSELNAKVGHFSLYESVIRQLEYVHAVVDGTEKDLSRVKDLTLGVLGAKEFDGDPELADRLLAVSAIVRRTVRRP